MATRKPLVLLSGQLSELPIGDAVEGGGSLPAWNGVAIDLPDVRKQHNIVVAAIGCLPASFVEVLRRSFDFGAGYGVTDLSLEPVSLEVTPAVDLFTLHITCLDGCIGGRHVIYYRIT